ALPIFGALQRLSGDAHADGARLLLPHAFRISPDAPSPLFVAFCVATRNTSASGHAPAPRMYAAPTARAKPPAPVDARSRREQVRSQRRSPTDEAGTNVSLRSPQIGRQGSTWARFSEEAESHQSFFRVPLPFLRSQCSSGFCHSYFCGRLWIRQTIGRGRFMSRKKCGLRGPPPHQPGNDLAAGMDPESELHYSALEVALVEVSQQA